MTCNVVIPCPLARMTVREAHETFGQEGGLLPITDFLCDYPVGKGKTCDLALCGCCRESIGEDRDLCRIHAAQFRGSSRVARQFSKPKLVQP